MSEFFDLIIVIIVLVAVFITFVRGKPPPEIAVVGGVGVLLATGVLSTSDVLRVFSNGAPVTIACMFILSAALDRTGGIAVVGALVSRLAGQSPVVMLVTLMGCVVITSALINNTPVVIILTPVMMDLARNIRMAPSRLLIPLSFASILGGACTLTGSSTNLLVAGIVAEQGLDPIGIFEITPLGIVLAIIGVAYIALIGRHLLPDRETLAGLLAGQPERHFLTEVVIPEDSFLIGKSLRQAGLLHNPEAEVHDLIRGDISLRFRHFENLSLHTGDRLMIHTNTAGVFELREEGGVEFSPDETAASRETIFVEGMIGPRSRYIGRRIADLNLRRRYGVHIVAVHRQAENLRENFGNIQVAFGDTLLLEGAPDGIRRLLDERTLVNLSEPQARPLRRARAPIAVAAILGVMILAAFVIMPIAGLAIIAAAVVLVFRCVDAEEAFEVVDWRILVLIFGMLALSAAIENAGAVTIAVSALQALAPLVGPLVILSLIYLITALLSEAISNNAVAVLLTPIAIGIAAELGVDPRPFVIAVIFGANSSFATPISYQTNLFVYNAGGYKFTDFARIGIPLKIIMWVAATLLIPIFWPLEA
jgi:di/tricarboxylate transporter